MLRSANSTVTAALIEPLTTRQPNHDDWIAHSLRAEIDLLRGDTDAAARRTRQIERSWYAGNLESVIEVTRRTADLNSWAGRPESALKHIGDELALITEPGPTLLCGRILTAGMRACADRADRAPAPIDQQGLRAAQTAAYALVQWVDEMSGTPFTDHPLIATTPAERATWDAERTRLTGPGDPESWDATARAGAAVGAGVPHSPISEAARADW